MQGTILEESPHGSRCLSCFSGHLTSPFRFGPFLRRLHSSSASHTSDHLSRVESSRSVFSPILALPLDILVLLFHSCKDDFISSVRHTLNEDYLYVQTDYPAWRPIPPVTLPSWIVCSHVCRRWRDIVLHTPSLWADIVLDTGPIWMTQSLIRSGPVHEVRFFGQLSPAFDNFFEKRPSLSVDFSRVSFISLGAHAPLLVSLLSSLSGNAPALRIVEVSDISDYSSLVNAVPLEPLIRNSPHIDRIVIRGVPITWNPLPTPTRVLTHLEINFDLYSPYFTTLLSQIEVAVEFLLGTPALEILSLGGCFTTSSTDAAGSKSAKAELPHLRALAMNDSAPTITYFLNHVDFPTASRVQLRFTSVRMSDDQAIQVISTALRRFSARPQGHVATGALALLSGAEGTGIQLLASSTVPANFHTIRTDDHFPEVDLHLRFDRWHPESRSRLLLAACNELPPGFVQTLAVEGPDVRMLWGRLAARFPDITHIICLDVPAAASLCSWLPWLQEASTNEGGEFPALQRLTMASRVHAHPLWKVHDTVERVLLSLLRETWGSMASSVRLSVSSTIDGNWVEVVGEVVDHALEPA
ncbi:hypothetical protein BC834DRAFT_890111 [Gloeopeniophorella convolvens]|nr:hypothetical protein BC834DRAFT_890111 [Gloeopeniophorella convolvens]